MHRTTRARPIERVGAVRSPACSRLVAAGQGSAGQRQLEPEPIGRRAVLKHCRSIQDVAHSGIALELAAEAKSKPLCFAVLPDELPGKVHEVEVHQVSLPNGLVRAFAGWARPGDLPKFSDNDGV